MPVIEGGISFTRVGRNNLIEVPRNAAVTIFENTALLQRDVQARKLGLYGEVSLGQNLEASFASLSTPKHLWSNRKNGCAWNPKGGVRMNIDRFPTCPIEYDGEQCPDSLYNTCFESIFAPGLGVRSFGSTPEAQKLLAQILKKINIGLGNSFHDLAHFANHPLIKTANERGFYKVKIKEWEDYIDQMLSGNCGGLITQLDELKAKGKPGFTRELPINTTTGAFSGDFLTELEKLKSDCSADMQTMIENGTTTESGVNAMPIVLATAEVFNQYKNYLRALAPTNELAYRYLISGTDGTTNVLRNVLEVDGMPVVLWEANTGFDKITGAKSHRLAIVAPGNFGILHDIDNLKQFDGMGLVVEQDNSVKAKGKVYMTTTLRWGAGIADIDLVAMSSNIVHPIS